MSTAQEVMDLADSNYRNNIPQTTKIKWLNYIVSQLFELQTSYKITQTSLVIQEGIQFYDLPTGCEVDDIRGISIETSADTGDFQDIDYYNIGEQPNPKGSYTIVEGMLMINPDPTEDKTGYIFYVAQPTVITVDNLNDEIDLDPTYHEILVHGLNERYAALRRDGVAKNNFNADYNALLGDFLWAQLNKAPSYSTVQDVSPRRARDGRKMVDPFVTIPTQ